MTDSLHSQRQIEFDLHGMVGIRLVDPSPNDLNAVRKQLGPLQGPLGRDPDITLRFVERLSAPHLRHLGFNQKGFNNDGFFVFQDGDTQAKARIPFERIGEPCEILCESGVRSVPLLMPILGLTALRKGYVPLHASAFVQNGVGVLMAGWANCGKTTALLGFASKGAEYIGEERVFLSGDGQRMYGLATELELSTWHLETLPHVRREIKHTKLLLLRGAHASARMIAEGKPRHSFVVRSLRKVLTAVEHQLRPLVAPPVIFGDRVRSLAAKPDKIFVLISRNGPGTYLEPTVPSEMARRMAFSVQYELMPLIEHYVAYRFAFPGARNHFVESMPEFQFEILSRALAGKETYTIWHPYPLVFSDLYEKLRPLFEAYGNVSSEAVQILA